MSDTYVFRDISIGLRRQHPFASRPDVLGNLIPVMPIKYNQVGFISGYTYKKGYPDIPVSCKVVLIDHSSMRIIAITWSDVNGYYKFANLDPSRKYDVIAYDHTHTYGAVIIDNRTADV